MIIGFIGLGKMGLNMALNVQAQGWEIIGYDVNNEARETANQKGLSVADSLDSLLKALNKKKVIFLSTPAGMITNQLVADLTEVLGVGDIIVDSGNSNFHDSVSNAEKAKVKGIYFIDCGTSGGLKGAREGACLMVGGEKEAVVVLEPFFKDLACENGYLYAGKSGAGHYLKMVHNGIEYAMMQAMGEGFNLLEASDYSFALDEVASVWNHGSIIEARLMGLAADIFSDDPTLASLEGKVASNGEAKWMIEEALRLEMPVPTTALSLFVRNESMLTNHFSNKVVASLRRGFGGHAVVESQ
ncbi:6-phosphogluconate dehydrogenase (decarboxylating) [Enterococcus sp. 7F3_DIV0205]|uniref:6-phosphogluconate dehydrogenase (Decarboxylating) n=1 Tax=Candidatus Enterococcus palustris TaxID=1834189 RepID=A0AAQ3WEP7_9ENTE|nr:decarboxylating 6-phosphogluconate dehydrogenase [Enterococcus sp. 7F3_DIV0205]OTN82834.1 6-phosphogluconate dehydrogenase (decarboxylating) [Enterococcus sp. 7F3_DIV0205]